MVNAAYLNPEDVLAAKNIVFLVDAIKKAEEVFTSSVKEVKEAKKEEKKDPSPKKK